MNNDATWESTCPPIGGVAGGGYDISRKQQKKDKDVLSAERIRALTAEDLAILKQLKEA